MLTPNVSVIVKLKVTISLSFESISNATLVNFSIFLGHKIVFTSYEKQTHLAFSAVLENLEKRNCNENRIKNLEEYGFKG